MTASQEGHDDEDVEGPNVTPRNFFQLPCDQCAQETTNDLKEHQETLQLPKVCHTSQHLCWFGRQQGVGPSEAQAVDHGEGQQLLMALRQLSSTRGEVQRQKRPQEQQHTAQEPREDLELAIHCCTHQQLANDGHLENNGGIEC
eukprot:Skav224625  [mRNA]  locus=scaffold2059:195130:199654:+ [translate_table: standard]